MTLFLLIGVVLGWIYGFSLVWTLLRHAFSKRKLKPKPPEEIPATDQTNTEVKTQ